jgi:hypothetical protein
MLQFSTNRGTVHAESHLGCVTLWLRAATSILDERIPEFMVRASEELGVTHSLGIKEDGAVAA